MSEDFTREVELGDGRTLTIHQELISDVGGVIWDSALVAAHLFLKNREYWMDKKVVELGAGTGVCGLVLGALGAEVLLTDLPERLPLLEKNLSENQHLLKGKVHAKSLDWLKDPIPESFSMVLLIDCIYYIDSIDPLLKLLHSSSADEFLCVFEKRDIGQPAEAQKLFFDSVKQYFHCNALPRSDFDPDYYSDDIVCLSLTKT